LDLDLWQDTYRWPLQRNAAEQAIRTRVAEPLGLDLVGAAAAVLEVTVANLVDAVRLVSVQRGYDPRGFALAAYGGAGPMYAVDIARALEIPEVIVPPAPGVTSALGLLQVDLAVHVQRSLLVRESQLDPEWVSALFVELEQQAAERLPSNGRVRVERQVDVRYFGQSRYMTIPAPSGAWGSETTSEVATAFNAAHEREYGYTMPASVSEVEFVNLRVLSSAPGDRVSVSAAVAGQTQSAETRRVHFPGLGFIEVCVRDRGSLAADERLEGPAMIEQADSTTVLPAGALARVGAGGELIIAV
jgi:N-methylhydantoinase A